MGQGYCWRCGIYGDIVNAHCISYWKEGRCIMEFDLNMPIFVVVDDFKYCRGWWEKGRCPCCGTRLEFGYDPDPEMVAEGVYFCGRCIENDHHTDPPYFLPILLIALTPNGIERLRNGTANMGTHSNVGGHNNGGLFPHKRNDKEA